MTTKQIEDYDRIMAVLDRVGERLDGVGVRLDSVGERLDRVAQDAERREKAQAEADARRKAEEAEAWARRKAEEAEAWARRKAEWAEADARREREGAEFDRRIKKLEKDLFGLSKNSGLHAETFFQRALARTLTFGGVKYDKMICNLKMEKKESCEFDIVLVNGDTVALIEAKHRVHRDFLEEVATKKLAQFRKYFPEYARYRVYLGVAGFSFGGEVLSEAHRRGVGLLRQDGKSIEEDTAELKAY